MVHNQITNFWGKNSSQITVNWCNTQACWSENLTKTSTYWYIKTYKNILTLEWMWLIFHRKVICETKSTKSTVYTTCWVFRISKSQRKKICNCPSECLIWKIACSQICHLWNRVYKIYTTCWLFHISKSQRKHKTYNCPSECLIWKNACSQICRMWDRVYKINTVCWLFHIPKSQIKK